MTSLRLFVSCLAAVCVVLPCNVASASSQPLQTRDEILRCAEKIGLRDDFVDLFEKRTFKDCSSTALNAETRLLRKLWTIEFEASSFASVLDQNRSELQQSIRQIRQRKERLASALDTANFLIGGVIAGTGNALFIDAPPPRPTVPNILFTVTGGISTSLSILSLAVQKQDAAVQSPVLTSFSEMKKQYPAISKYLSIEGSGPSPTLDGRNLKLSRLLFLLKDVEERQSLLSNLTKNLTALLRILDA